MQLGGAANTLNRTVIVCGENSGLSHHILFGLNNKCSQAALYSTARENRSVFVLLMI